MQFEIRQEEEKDYLIVEEVIKAAFAEEKISDHDEQLLVRRIRKSGFFVPQLSLVAVKEGQIIGHILLSEVLIKNQEATFLSLALAPVSVLPSFQNMGVGSKLIKTAHIRAKALDYDSIVLIGHAEYYPRFGYVPASQHKVEFPFEAPDRNCMILELAPHSLEGVSGIVEYSAPFLTEEDAQ